MLAYDPAGVETPDGVQRINIADELVSNCKLILALTGGQDAVFAMNQSLHAIPENIVYADLSSNSVAIKQELADTARANNFLFVDVALMSIVPGKGLNTPMLAAGTGAEKFLTLCEALPVSIDIVSDQAGDASMRKLLRSIMMKGLAGTVIEALRGAEKAGCKEWLWKNIAEEIKKADESMLRRFVRGTEKHAERRIHEMESSLALLQELNIDAPMTSATVECFRRVKETGVPDIPS